MRHRAFLVVGLLALPGLSAATVYSVGSGGDFSTLQAALDAATQVAGSHEIHARAATYAENLTVTSMTASSVQLSGGWNAGFTARTMDPNQTIVDGNFAGRVVALTQASGDMVFDGVSLTHGQASILGGGVLFQPGGGDPNSTVTFENCRIVENRVSGSSASGGGIDAELTGSTRLALSHTTVALNQLSNNTAAYGAGIYIAGASQASFSIKNSRVEANSMQSSSTSYRSGIGLFVDGGQAFSGEILDSLFQDNLDHGPLSGGMDSTGVRLQLIGASSGTITFRRNRVYANLSDNITDREQVSLRADPGAVLIVSDSVIAAGPAIGVQTIQNVGADPVRLTNVTVDGHSSVEVSGVVEVYNSILTRQISVNGSNNLLGVADLFENPAARDYRPKNTSQALNFGTNAPPGGLGPSDVTGGPRVLDGTVDAGAYEIVAATPTPTSTSSPTPSSTGTATRTGTATATGTATPTGTPQPVGVGPERGVASPAILALLLAFALLSGFGGASRSIRVASSSGGSLGSAVTRKAPLKTPS